MEIGEVISYYRRLRGLTIDELVNMSGVPKGTLNKIMNGVTNSPKVETVKCIARALNITLDDIDAMQNSDVEQKTSEAAVTAPEDQPITLDESNALLVKLGYIKPGEDLSDDDLAFLTHLIGLLDAWFDRH